MKYILTIIVCLLGCPVMAQERPYSQDTISQPNIYQTHQWPSQPQQTVSHVHRHHHYRIHHVHRPHVEHPVHHVVPIPRPRPFINQPMEDPMGNPFTSENAPIAYPYATGTSILDAFSGRAPVTYCEPTYPNTHVGTIKDGEKRTEEGHVPDTLQEGPQVQRENSFLGIAKRWFRIPGM